jgi:tetratricopeptide (TPR) repeat protein
MRKIMLIAVALALAGALSPLAADGGSAGQPPTLRDAMALDRQGKSAEAIALIREIMARQPDGENFDGHMSLGVVYFRMKKYDDALSEFDRTIAIRKENPMAYYFEGLIYEKKALGESAGAARALQEKALVSWKNYLQYAGTARRRPEVHRHIGRSVEDAIRRAKQHISILKEKLGHE